ncbi:restriction endonuclease subunit S [Pseudophaeobacter sp.]|uniref:restriction endonuclease subunit S n=1 Tax=Pseudophaeobacter sp. TaxID=1971739 RepID=UPI004059247E
MKEGWKEKSLGEVCKIQSGAGFPLKHQGNPVGDYPFFKVGDMNTRGNEEYLIEAPNFISEDVRKTLGARILPPDSIVFPKVGGAIATNKKRRISVPSCVDNNVMGLIPNRDEIDPDYLAWWMHGTDIYEFSNKANPPSITKATVKDWPIPLPPLEEQKRIVTVLNEAFEGLARARTHAEANLQNARELFDQMVAREFDHLMEENQSVPLQDLTTKITKGSSPKWQGISYVDEPGVLFVTSENVVKNEINLTKTKFVEEAFNEKDKKSILSAGDVLTNIVGASIGRTAVFDLPDMANINQAVCLIRCNPDRLQNYYLSYLLNSPFFKAALHKGEVNMARANLSLTFFRELEVPVPTVEKQKDVVKKILALQKQTASVEKRYSKDIDDLDDLRQSLLQKAFAGDLT